MRAAVLKTLLTRDYSDVYLTALYLVVGAVAYVATPSTWKVSVPLVPIGTLAGVFILRAEARRRTRKAGGIDPHALETYQIEITEAGFRTWCAHIDCRFTWDSFTQIRETTEFYLFLRAPGSFAVPKRLLDDATEAELRGLIETWSQDHGRGLARIAGAPERALSRTN
jgi:hypothetical protein